jgi:hypothetical protein
MPEFLPDVHEIREDMCGYLGEVPALDRMFGVLLEKLFATNDSDDVDRWLV